MGEHRYTHVDVLKLAASILSNHKVFVDMYRNGAHYEMRAHGVPLSARGAREAVRVLEGVRAGILASEQIAKTMAAKIEAMQEEAGNEPVKPLHDSIRDAVKCPKCGVKPGAECVRTVYADDEPQPQPLGANHPPRSTAYYSLRQSDFGGLYS